MWTQKFWRQVAERAIKTAAGAASAFFVVGSTDLATLNFAAVASGVGVATIASVLLSIVSAPLGPGESPSLVEVDGK